MNADAPLDHLVRLLAGPIAEAVAKRVGSAEPASEWLTRKEAIEYSRLPKGTFDKLAASQRLPSHHKGRLFNRRDLDRALRSL